MVPYDWQYLPLLMQILAAFLLGAKDGEFDSLLG